MSQYKDAAIIYNAAYEDAARHENETGAPWSVFEERMKVPRAILDAAMRADDLEATKHRTAK